MLFSDFHKSTKTATTVDCTKASSIICEDDHSDPRVISQEINEISRFLKPLSNFFSAEAFWHDLHETLFTYLTEDIRNTKHQALESLYISKIKLDWFSAKSFCKRNGMELLTPENHIDEDELKEAFTNNDEVGNKLHLGISSIGNQYDGGWYSVESGRVLHLNFEYKEKNPTFGKQDCLQWNRDNIKETFKYEVGNCFTLDAESFVCRDMNQDNIDVKFNSVD